VFCCSVARSSTTLASAFIVCYQPLIWWSRPRRPRQDCGTLPNGMAATSPLGGYPPTSGQRPWRRVPHMPHPCQYWLQHGQHQRQHVWLRQHVVPLRDFQLQPRHRQWLWRPSSPQPRPAQRQQLRGRCHQRGGRPRQRCAWPHPVALLEPQRPGCSGAQRLFGRLPCSCASLQPPSAPAVVPAGPPMRLRLRQLLQRTASQHDRRVQPRRDRLQHER
jgi:hypothetical protein